MKNLSAFIDYLESLEQSKHNDISKEIAIEALDRPKEDVLGFFEDLLNHGCKTGMISSLISYRQTHTFFDKHYSEIIDLKKDYELETGENLIIPTNIKNFMAWWAYENVAHKIFCVGEALSKSTIYLD